MADSSANSPISATVVDELLKGAVDLHVHSGPSVMPRLVDHIQALEEGGGGGGGGLSCRHARGAVQGPLLSDRADR